MNEKMLEDGSWMEGNGEVYMIGSEDEGEGMVGAGGRVSVDRGRSDSSTCCVICGKSRVAILVSFKYYSVIASIISRFTISQSRLWLYEVSPPAQAGLG